METMVLQVTGIKTSEVKSAISKLLEEAKRMHLEVSKPRNEKVRLTKKLLAEKGAEPNELHRKCATVKGEMAVIQSLRYMHLNEGVYFAVVPLKR
ncbi:MAG: hypothetical protein KGH52_02330 [Candidatus Micrarchaeota archaeon]|nr:hypothetical protein [Candidatus Micrarchaeota archaeon]